ncbi:hypothetical protein GCM10009662_27240 [Catellatospora coxensis]|uniref:Uncharacterized protein n=2 Tax=Catellatospora coxensis TaxID=310354 RepID=A0A8J3L2F3_9ACTN|nr:hypothetical protein Cco03nite_40560 [Catellatospora coxensis]
MHIEENAGNGHMQEHSDGVEAVPPVGRPRRAVWAVSALVAVLAVGAGAVWFASGGDEETPAATEPAAWSTSEASAAPTPSELPSASPTPSPSAQPSVQPSPSKSPTKVPVRITLRVPSTLDGIAKSTESVGPVPTELKQRYVQAKWVSGAYGDAESAGGKKIAFYAATSTRLKSPATEMQWLTQNMADDGFAGFFSVSTGSFGGAAKCGHQEVLGSVYMCAWADSGSIGMVMLWDYDQNEAKAAFPRVRAQIERRA